MLKFDLPERRWLSRSDQPILLSASARAGWQGFEFQEIQVPDEGEFNESSTNLRFIWISGPVEVRARGKKKPFIEPPYYPLFFLPDEAGSGEWRGAHRVRNLFLDPNAVERLTHRSFHETVHRHAPRYAPSAEHLLRALHMDIQHGHPSGRMLGETIVTALLHHLLSCSAPPLSTPERDLLSQNEFKRLFDWIEANLPRPVSLEDLAREADVSLRHLHRAFLAATGLSPYKYILTRRVERAKLLIEDGQLSLSEIAGAVGFCSQAHMAHTFSKLLRVSPSQISNRSKHSRF